MSKYSETERYLLEMYVKKIKIYRKKRHTLINEKVKYFETKFKCYNVKYLDGEVLIFGV